MSRNQKIKEVIENEFDLNQNLKKIQEKIERKEKVPTRNNWKAAFITSVFILTIIGSLFVINQSSSMKQGNKKETINQFQILAYVDQQGNSQKESLKENVKIALKSYNKAISSVPGYPLIFELEDTSSKMEVRVENGDIYTWDSSSGKVEKQGKEYIIQKSQTLYFDVNENTRININYHSKENHLIRKKITIESDDKFNYYATLSN